MFDIYARVLMTASRIDHPKVPEVRIKPTKRRAGAPPQPDIIHPDKI